MLLRLLRILHPVPRALFSLSPFASVHLVGVSVEIEMVRFKL